MRVEFPVPRIVIAGATSGVGKTTLTAGLCAALRSRGLRVQPFKCGPDYIDPSYHAAAAGRPCRNLDSWMLNEEAMTHLFARAMREADVAIIEGVMGLFDGRGPDGEGSTASIAKALGTPVVLVIDADKTAQSAGAIALGYRSFDPELNIVGVILNQVGSPGHASLCRASIEGRAKLPILGYLPGDPDLRLPERHLGLVPTVEDAGLIAYIERIRERVEASVDVDTMLEMARAAPPLALSAEARLFPECLPETRTVIAVAMDEAFNFYYQDNLDLLEAWGARLVPVSPLHDPYLPSQVRGVYIGGGFPELFAEQLAGNASFIRSLREAIREGLPVYAECGGLMYLSEGIVDFEGKQHPMVGIVPGQCVMQKRYVRLGYVVAEALRDSPIARRGQHLRGHAFHWSQREVAAGQAAYRFIEPVEEYEGFGKGNVLASYLHVHFGSDASLACRFVDLCSP